jgi:hypothetical protein
MKFLREPLIHFLALGAGLFLLFALVGGSDNDSTDRITITSAQVELLAEGFARTWQRPPSAQDMVGLIDDFVRDEIYYREAIAMGLDRDDTIIRRRMRQKLEFFTDDVIAAVEPSDEELSTYLAVNQAKFRVAGRVSFEHIYFNADRRGEAVTVDAEHLLAQLAEGSTLDTRELGDGLPLPRKYADAPIDKVGTRFGAGFAEALTDLPVGEWAGPIESGYGLHLVLVSERQPGNVPAFEEVREVVEREWRAERREEAKETFFQGLRERYEVIVEEPAGASTALGSETGTPESYGIDR